MVFAAVVVAGVVVAIVVVGVGCGGGTKKPPWPIGGQREITPAGFRVKSTFAMKCLVDHHDDERAKGVHDASRLTNDDDTTDDHRKHHC